MKTAIKHIHIIAAAFLINPLLGCGNASFSSFETAPPSNVVSGEEDEGPASETAPDVPFKEFKIEQEVEKFKTRYDVEDIYTKITDNRGEGDSDVYGTRNMRAVLHGVMYRGGGNNKYLETPRSNTNPLPTVGLKNLCKEDFSTGVYLYSENFSTAPKSVACANTSHQPQTLQYKQMAADGEKEKILALVYARIKGQLNGPVYAHCWNGWHSSGLISAIALKQFCGWSDAAADAYWVKNTDGNSSGFTTLRNKIKAFKPLAKYSITAEEKAAICP